MAKILEITHGINHLYWISFYLIYFSKIEAQCVGNGLDRCACNFIGACQWDPSKESFKSFAGSTSDLTKFIPNVGSFAKASSSVAEICEADLIGIIYDCENRIPLASTIILTADQYGASNSRPPINFIESSQISSGFQQQDKDYEAASKREPCFEAPGGQYYIEHNWWRTLTTKTIAPWSRPHSNECAQNKVSVHRGHLIASQYGRTQERAMKTFVYTNAVPQFGKENTGSWNQFERRLVKWANENCQKAPLHVIVGGIPSTYGRNNARFFGEGGFSNYVGISTRHPGKQPYRVNVPAYLWTAACCYLPSRTRNTAFYAPNEPGRGLVNSVRLSDLFSAVRAVDVDLFPGMPSCNDDKNYISL